MTGVQTCALPILIPAVQEAAAWVIAGFRKNVAAVEELLDFDRFILDFAIDGMVRRRLNSVMS